MRFYLIGSLRNPEIPQLAQKLRATGHEIFDEWYSAGPHADDAWRDHQKAKGLSYVEALDGEAARHVFDFDYHHLTRADGVILALPAGRSGHLEFGWAIGRGKLGYILLDRPDRWDVMYRFATGVFETVEGLTTCLTGIGNTGVNCCASHAVLASGTGPGAVVAVCSVR